MCIRDRPRLGALLRVRHVHGHYAPRGPSLTCDLSRPDSQERVLQPARAGLAALVVAAPPCGAAGRALGRP
eukprot:5902578-Alexandrium_andersonii.AAC.1